MALDWGKPVLVLKLDIRKAFDSFVQARLGKYIFKRVAVQGGKPREARLWLQLVQFEKLLIQTHGGNIVVVVVVVPRVQPVSSWPSQAEAFSRYQSQHNTLQQTAHRANQASITPRGQRRQENNGNKPEKEERRRKGRRGGGGGKKRSQQQTGAVEREETLTANIMLVGHAT